MKNLSYILLIAIGILSGCEEIISVDLNETEPVLVVDGLITNQAVPQYVKLSLSTSYFEDQPIPMVSGALVIITENGSLADTLAEVKPGYYQTQKIVQGQVGAQYDLRIIYDGEIYEASTVLRPVAAIDSITQSYKESGLFFDEGYYVALWAQETPGLGDYYRWVYYSNGQIADSLDLLYASDEFVDGSYIANFEFFYEQQVGDSVKVEQYSLTKDAYEFYSQLDEQVSFGNLFDTPPANITGNISNDALGLFQASALVSKEIVIQ